MTNLDSTLKSRYVTLPTKVRLVKAMVFPVVMYGCESWTKEANYSQNLELTNTFFLMEMFVLSYVNVPQILSSSWFHQMAQTT